MTNTTLNFIEEYTVKTATVVRMKYSYKTQFMKKVKRKLKKAVEIAKAVRPAVQNDKGQPRSPNKEIVPKMNLARNTKFHKLFKELPPDEICIKGYSCAFLGDILIQGYLYISPNYFCFHSRILGIQRQIKIPVYKVLNITRERTAIFIPNAIGIVTSEDKYVFGSLLGRDNTYRLMFTVWKTLTQEGDSKPGLADIDMSIDDVENGETNNNISKENGSIDSSESEGSICVHCGVPLADHSGVQCDACSDDVTEGPYVDVVPPPNTPVQRETSTTPSTPSTFQAPSSGSITPTQSSSQVSQAAQKSSVMHKLLRSARESSRTHLILSLCLVMVFVLASSAVIMLYKILVLQAKLETSPAAALPLDGPGLYTNMYYLNQEYHMTTIKRFHSVLEANIQVLDQIFHSLKGLQDSVNLPSTGCSAGSSDTVTNNAQATLNDKT